MRISDWSSDVCSSDLLRAALKLGGQLLVEPFDLGKFLGLHIGHFLKLRKAFGDQQLREGFVHVEFLLAHLGTLDEHLLPLLAFVDRKSTRLNSSHSCASRMPSSA